MELLFLALLLVTMAVALASGFPVAFALPGSAILTIGAAALTGYVFTGDTDAFFYTGGPQSWLSAAVTNQRGVYWEIERDTLIAIPLFIFMGIMLQKSKIAEDLLLTMAQLFGRLPGGLGVSVVIVGALLAATTGILGATVIAMGMISLPAMLRNRYSPELATGVISASGTLGQIIPPSIVLIILADQLASASDQASSERRALYQDATGEFSMPSFFDVSSTSAGELFLGAMLPGLVLVGLYILYLLIYTFFRPEAAPAVPFEGDYDTKFWLRVGLALVPPLTLILLVLGSIITGVATVNQAGAIGSAGALIMAGYRLYEGRKTTYIPLLLSLVSLAIIAVALNLYDLNFKSVLATGGDMTGVWIGLVGTIGLIVALIWSALRVFAIDDTLGEVMIDTAKTTSLVFVIILGAALLTAAFKAFGGADLVRDFLDSLPGGFWGKFFFVMLVIFILGFFLDFIEIAVVVVPIVAPILLADPSANITAVWLGVMIGLNIQTSFLTPPFGFALFFLRGVAPAVVKTVQMYRGVIPFIILQLIGLGIVAAAPQIVNYLPNRSSMLSETAPPPRNPGLQYCLDTYTIARIEDERQSIDAALASARALDVSALPTELRDGLSAAYGDVDLAIAKIDEIAARSAAVQEAAPAYRPVLRLVRGIEEDIRELEDELGDLRIGMRRERGNEAEVARLAGIVAEREAEVAALQAAIPADWEDVYARFQGLLDAEETARRDYRLAGSRSFEAVAGIRDMIAAAPGYAALDDTISGIGEVLRSGGAEAVAVAAGAASTEAAALPGGGTIAALLTDLRRAAERAETTPRELANLTAQAGELVTAERDWIERVPDQTLSGLEDYLAMNAPIFGARVQPDLTRDQALWIARCRSVHRDVSIYF